MDRSSLLTSGIRRGSRIGPKSAKCMKWSAMWATRCRSWPNGAGAHCRGVLVLFAPLGSSGLRARDGSLLLVWANQQSALASPALLLFVHSRRAHDRHSGTRTRTKAGVAAPCCPALGSRVRNGGSVTARKRVPATGRKPDSRPERLLMIGSWLMPQMLASAGVGNPLRAAVRLAG